MTASVVTASLTNCPNRPNHPNLHHPPTGDRAVAPTVTPVPASQMELWSSSRKADRVEGLLEAWIIFYVLRHAIVHSFTEPPYLCQFINRRHGFWIHPNQCSSGHGKKKGDHPHTFTAWSWSFLCAFSMGSDQYTIMRDDEWSWTLKEYALFFLQLLWLSNDTIPTLYWLQATRVVWTKTHTWKHQTW